MSYNYDREHNKDSGKQPGDPVGFNSKMGWGNVFERNFATPLDRTSLFVSYEDALAYATGGNDKRGLSGTSYPGQIITVLSSDTAKPEVYIIKGAETIAGRTLVKLGEGGGGGGGGSSAEIYWNDEDGIIIGNDTRVTFIDDTWTLITVTGAASKTAFGIGNRTDNAAKIEFGTGVTSIDANGFENNTNLAEMTIPTTCTSIGANAFKGCVNLTKIDCTTWTTGYPSLDSTDPFDGITRSNVTVVIPSGATQSDWENNGWSGFTFTTPNP